MTVLRGATIVRADRLGFGHDGDPTWRATEDSNL
jgi:hypothetical protein